MAGARVTRRQARRVHLRSRPGSRRRRRCVRSRAHAGDAPAARLTRLTRGGGAERFPAWAPDSARVSYTASRPGEGAAIWVTELPRTPAADSAPAGARGAGPGGATWRGPRRRRRPCPSRRSSRVGRERWRGRPTHRRSPSPRSPTAQAGYNGNPNRNDDDETVLSADAGEQVLWRVAAPRPIDDGARAVTIADAGRRPLGRPVRSRLARR